MRKKERLEPRDNTLSSHADLKLTAELRFAYLTSKNSMDQRERNVTTFSPSYPGEWE